MKTLLSVFHCLSPLHAGVGQGIGTIDLPIAREKSTNIPIVPGSSVKGVLRDRCLETDVQEALFGPDTRRASEFAGSVYFSDLTLLCLPVRSLQGVFSWTTSPYVLRRFQRDLQGDPNLKKLKIPKLDGPDQALVASDTLLHDKKVYLEELDLSATESPDAKNWAEALGKLLFGEDEEWKRAFTEQFCICHDDVFSFLMETGTEVTARIKLDEESKTVARGGLWYEEALPVETLLYGLVHVDQPRGGRVEIGSVEELHKLVERPLQIGGKASVGRGFGWLKLSEVKS